MPAHSLKPRAAKAGLKAKSPRFRVGDRVKVRFGAAPAAARIIEDRGPIGVKGRRLVRVQLIMPRKDPDLSFEVPVDDLIANGHARRKP